jgi:hypothetical protein
VAKRALGEIPLPNEMFTCGKQAKSFSFIIKKKKKNTVNPSKASGSISPSELSGSFKVAKALL